MRKIIIPAIVAGIIMLIAGMIVSTIFNTIFPSLNAEYLTPGLFRPWSDPLMMLFFAYPILFALILSWVWDSIKVLFKEKDKLKRGLRFGLCAWVAFSIPGMFVSYTSFPVSLLMISSWLASGLAYCISAGLVFSRLNA